jgi:3-hydroxybutyryl-CoA dehydrogenase
MVIAVLADNNLKEEFLSRPVNANIEVLWPDSIRSMGIIEADVYMDLLFDLDRERILQLKKLLPAAVFVNSVTHSLKVIGEPFIRLNGWPTMLRRDITEVAVNNPAMERTVKNIFDGMGWKYQLVPDTAGMVTPRIVSMIINEAWYTFGEGISTKEEIDTAMKLGTNYPFGPFEWGEKIGLDSIKNLLKELSYSDERYTIAPSLLNEK